MANRLRADITGMRASLCGEGLAAVDGHARMLKFAPFSTPATPHV